MSEGPIEQFYSVSQLAKMLNVKNYTVRRWIAAGELEAIRLPGARGDYRISETEAKRLVNNTYGSKK